LLLARFATRLKRSEIIATQAVVWRSRVTTSHTMLADVQHTTQETVRQERFAVRA